MTRKPLMAGNWKMNLTHLEGIQLVQNIAYHLSDEDTDRTDVAVIPPFTALRSIQTVIEADGLKISLGAQHCHHEESGAFTGCISTKMLSALGCSYVVAGHSERRTLFGQTDEDVNTLVKTIIAAGMTPIMCVGESKEERSNGETVDVLSQQVGKGLDGVSAQDVAELVIAYEPIWAIGTGETALPEDANDGCGVVREQVRSTFGDDAADAVRIQYGGSVKPGNVATLMAQPEIDGALVGGASLTADDFAVIARYHRL